MQLPEGVVDLGYRPRPWQLEAHRRRKRWTVLVWHRRAGKTVFAVMAMLHEAIKAVGQKVERPQFAYIAPLYRQAKDVAWDILKSYALKIPGAQANESELRVDLPGGARIRLYGADNPDTLRGIRLDGVVMDEVAQMSPRMWSEVIRPALADRQGWAVWIGTPKGRNSFCEIYERAKRDEAGEWYAELRPVSETKALPETELADARRQMTPEEYDQEFECSFQAAIVGAYFGREMAQAEADGRLTVVPHDPGRECITAWDLGIGDSTAIWIIQIVGMQVRVIDYIESGGVGLDWYAKELDRRPYRYGMHYLPHDAAARELGTGVTREETMRGLGLGRTKIVPRIDVIDGINAVRRLLSRCWFDAKKCERGIEALRQYRRAWDEKGQTFRPHPLHDWTSHGSDAARCLAVGLGERGVVEAVKKRRDPWDDDEPRGRPSAWAA